MSIVDLSSRAQLAAQIANVILSADTSRLDALIDRTATEFDVDGAHVSMLTDEQVSVGSCGAMLARYDRGSAVAFEDTICSNVLRVEGPLVIPDARTDMRVSSVPAVAAGFVGAYLGMPIVVDGHRVGVLCVFHSERRDWTDAELGTLERLADEFCDEVQRLMQAAGDENDS